PGRVRLVDAQGELQPTPVAELPLVQEVGEGGLMGIAVHPQFIHNGFVYLYYTYGVRGQEVLNRLSRFSLSDDRLQDERVLLDGIPGASIHNGGRIAFGPDGYLY